MNTTSLLGMMTTVLGTVCASTAMAELKYETGNGGSVQIYGQFSPAYLSFDDGVSTTDDIVDNTNSNSRIGLWYRAPTDSGEFSVNLETAFGLRPSGGLNQIFTPDGFDWERTNIRKVEAIWKDNRYGSFFLGQGSMTSDGATSQDLSGTTLVLYNSLGDTSGAFVFRTAAGALSLKTVGQAFASYDGGRKARVRYDTPALNGLKLSVSYGEEVLAENVDEKVTDIGVFYSEQVGSVTMEGALAYSHLEFGNGATRYDTVGSFSVLHSSGFNVTVAAGRRNTAGDYVYGKLGYKGDWLPVGSTALAIDYYSGQDTTSPGSDSDSVGIGVVQTFEAANIEAYLGYREYGLTETTETYRDASSVLFGARWKF